MDHDKGFRKIVLATDGSPEAESAVDETIGLARFTPATVRVLHIWNLEVHHRRGFWDVELRTQAEQLVQATADRLIKAGVMAETEVYHADNDYVPQAVADPSQRQPQGPGGGRLPGPGGAQPRPARLGGSGAKDPARGRGWRRRRSRGAGCDRGRADRRCGRDGA